MSVTSSVPAGQEANRNRSTLRVGTYNVLHGRSVTTGRVDLAALASTIEDLGCDAVALQEVDRGLPRSDGEDQLGWLVRRLGWHGAFAPALLGDPGGRWQATHGDDPGGPAFGVGLLARTPLSRVRRLVLPGGAAAGQWRPPAVRVPGWPGWDHEPRVALAADVAVGGVTATLVSLHLSYLPWRSPRQLRAAARATGRSRTVLLGDLNLPRWPAGLALGPGWTSAGVGGTYPAWRPRLQLDQAHVTTDLAIESATGRHVGHSDHRPVVATIRPRTP